MAATTTTTVHQQFIVQKTAEERRQDDAVFLSQNTETRLFNIQSFHTNLMDHPDVINGTNGRSTISTRNNNNNNNIWNISKQLITDKECESSPLFFKFSGNVAYVPQLNGCCIFYNSGMTKQQMDILYSSQCQMEVLTEACKLMKNAFPNYKHLLQFNFLRKLSKQFNLMGLSEDTLLLTVKSGLPSQTGKFILNAAQLQLRILRFNFIISPNLTHVYMKTYMQPSLCQQNQNRQDETMNDATTIQNNSTINLDISGGGGHDDGNIVNSRKENILNVDDFPLRYEDDDEDDDDDDDESSNSDSDDENVIFNNKNLTCVKPPAAAVLKPAIIVNDEMQKQTTEAVGGGGAATTTTKTAAKRPQPLSAQSSETASSRDHFGVESISSHISSIGLIQPDGNGPRSDTGLTTILDGMKCRDDDGRPRILENIKLQSSSTTQSVKSTTLTGNMANLKFESEADDDDGGATSLSYQEFIKKKKLGGGSETGASIYMSNLKIQDNTSTRSDISENINTGHNPDPNVLSRYKYNRSQGEYNDLLTGGASSLERILNPYKNISIYKIFGDNDFLLNELNKKIYNPYTLQRMDKTSPKFRQLLKDFSDIDLTRMVDMYGLELDDNSEVNPDFIQYIDTEMILKPTDRTIQAIYIYLGVNYPHFFLPQPTP